MPSAFSCRTLRAASLASARAAVLRAEGPGVVSVPRQLLQRQPARPRQLPVVRSCSEHPGNNAWFPPRACVQTHLPSCRKSSQGALAVSLNVPSGIGNATTKSLNGCKYSVSVSSSDYEYGIAWN